MTVTGPHHRQVGEVLWEVKSPQLLNLGGPTMHWSPNFLAVVFKKQEILSPGEPTISSHQNAGFSI